MYKALPAFVLLTTLAFAAAAQEPDPRDTRQTGGSTAAATTTPADSPWEFFVRGNGHLYENFFQAPDDAAEEDVSALMGEVGGSFRFANAMRAYASANYLRYDDEALDSSTGVRAGVRMDGRPHAFDVFAEQLFDRPTFDVGDEFDRADIRTIGGEYAYRFARDWQVSIDGELQKQEYDLTTIRDNEFTALGAAVRWRGMRIFSPEIGFRSGARDVQQEDLGYDQREAYLQIRSSVTPRLYLSSRFRDRRREYHDAAREDTRRQLTLSADYRLTPTLTITLYGAHEDVDTNLPNRDFTTRLWIAGLTWRF